MFGVKSVVSTSKSYTPAEVELVYTFLPDSCSTISIKLSSVNNASLSSIDIEALIPTDDDSNAVTLYSGEFIFFVLSTISSSSSSSGSSLCAIVGFAILPWFIIAEVACEPLSPPSFTITVTPPFSPFPPFSGLLAVSTVVLFCIAFSVVTVFCCIWFVFSS